MHWLQYQGFSGDLTLRQDVPHHRRLLCRTMQLYFHGENNHFIFLFNIFVDKMIKVPLFQTFELLVTISNLFMSNLIQLNFVDYKVKDPPKLQLKLALICFFMIIQSRRSCLDNEVLVDLVKTGHLTKASFLLFFCNKNDQF